MGSNRCGGGEACGERAHSDVAGAATSPHTTLGAHALRAGIFRPFLSFPHKPHLPEYSPGSLLWSPFTDLATLLILWVLAPAQLPPLQLQIVMSYSEDLDVIVISLPWDS